MGILAKLLARLERLKRTPPSRWADVPPDVVRLLELQGYPGYQEEDLAVFDRFLVDEVPSQPGFLTDSLGVRTRVTTLPDPLQDRAGQTLGPPIPEDTYHAETVEYLGLLKSVAAARARYTALELGAGWGPWLVAGAVAARHIGIDDLRLYGVEGDAEHVGFMRQHFVDNGLDPDAHQLINAAVGAEAGTVRWPKAPAASHNTWGMRPVKPDSEADRGYLETAGASADEFIDMKVVSIAELLGREAQWDLVHIDIQGWEDEVCRAGMPLLCERVRYVVVGTHSRKLDGDLMALFHGAGWILEHEKPAKMQFSATARTLENMTLLDGTQVWRNPRL